MTLLKSLFVASALMATPVTVFAAGKAPAGSEIVATADAAVGLNGLVCDFCSIALNKTFKKQAAVDATYVDLDTKTLSIAFKDGQTLDNDTIIELVKKAGYSVTKIARKDGSEFIPPSG